MFLHGKKFDIEITLLRTIWKLMKNGLMMMKFPTD